uniref:ATP synthase F0 subunit 8 n=1 Tax=Singhiella simplex TaxID=1608328 RepID=A0A7G2CVH4_9HEMI|nr:ATP synthase F0 subunit 8 [Singhiella simplex]
MLFFWGSWSLFCLSFWYWFGVSNVGSLGAGTTFHSSFSEEKSSCILALDLSD